MPADGASAGMVTVGTAIRAKGAAGAAAGGSSILASFASCC